MAEPSAATASGDDVDDVSRQIKGALGRSLTLADLAICGGMDESDILFAETCAEMGARVRLMMREPVASERGIQWPPLASSDWRERLRILRQKHYEQIEVWIDTDHLGPIQAGEQHPAELATRRHVQWLINTAKMEAWPTDSQLLESAQIQLHAIVLTGTHHAPKDSYTAELVHEIEKFNRYQGRVDIISLQTDALNPHRASDPRLPGAASVVGESADV
jgi:hypothetical protein